MPPPDGSPSSRARSRARARPPRARLSLSPPFAALPFLLLLDLASSVSAASLASRRLVHPALGDVTAVASYAVDARTVITALGSNDVPSRVHFLAHCDAARDARHDGAFTLPPGVGPARSAAAHAPGYLVLGTAQSPGAIVPAGALTGDPIVLLPGEDVLAAAAALPRATPTSPPAFVFATWTAPSRLVLVEVDERSRRLRADALRRATMPPGVDFVRAAVADPRGGVVRIATDTDPAVVVAVDVQNLRVVDALVLPRPARHVRAGASSPDGRHSYWVTHDDPSAVVRLTHDTPDGAAVSSGVFELDPRRGEVRAASVGADADGVVYVGFEAPDAFRGEGGAKNDDVEGVYGVYADAASAVALVDGGDAGLSRLSSENASAIRASGARAMLFARGADGAGYYVTRSSPSEMIVVDHRDDHVVARAGPVAVETNANRDANATATATANSKSTSTSSSSSNASFACVAFVNATHAGGWRAALPPGATIQIAAEASGMAWTRIDAREEEWRAAKGDARWSLTACGERGGVEPSASSTRYA